MGGGRKSQLSQRCIRSWRKYCPDYEIKEWNEWNFDIQSAPLFVQQAYECKKYAFVTDWVRLKVVYNHGGIYFDTDVELIKNPDFLLEHSAFFGFEEVNCCNTGLGFGAERGHTVLLEMMEDYNERPFILGNGEYNTFACPKLNTVHLVNRGLSFNNTMQVLDGNIAIYPTTYFRPMDYFGVNMTDLSEKTVSIHHYSSSWIEKEEKNKILKSIYKTYWPQILLKKVIGHYNYEKLRRLWHR